MLALVIVLLVTNLVAIGAAVVLWRTRLGPETAPDPALAAALPTPRGAPGETRPRRLISVEIHNPIELAGHRNRMFGIAGSLVPDLTRRVVYDQTAKLLREGLAEHRVVADVRVLAFGPATPAPALAERPTAPAHAPTIAGLAPLTSDVAEDEEPDRLAD